MPKVLVVDDSPTVRAHMASLLVGSFDCVTAENGIDGLRKVVDEKPDLVVADLEMPEMDGIAFLAALRAQSSAQALPVLIATTVTSIEKVNQCRRLGCSGFVLKPIQKDYLLAKIRGVLSKAP